MTKSLNDRSPNKLPTTKLVEDCPPDRTLHIYTRVSTVEQKLEGTSLETQYEEGVHRSKQLGFFYRHWDEGGKSSNHEEIADRPVLHSLYSAIKTDQIKHLFIYDQSRLSRNDLVASVFRYECRKRGVTIYTKDGQYNLSNPSDNLLTQVMNAVAEFDNSVRADKMRRGRVKRARQGLWITGTPPYGYKVVDKKLVVVPEEAQWVQQIFEKRAAGVNIQEIRTFLSSNGVLPRFRNLWNGASIRKMIRNTHHIGYYTVVDRLNGGEYQINCPPIVSKDLWTKANDAINKTWLARKSRPKDRTAVLFRSLLYCGHCGRSFVLYDTQKTKSTVYYCPMKQREWARLGRAEHEKRRFTGCGMDRSIRVSRVDTAVLDLIREVLTDEKRYRDRFEYLALSGKSLIDSHRQSYHIKRKISDLVDERRALLALIEEKELMTEEELRQREGLKRVCYEERTQVADITEKIDEYNLRLDEWERYEKFSKWLSDIRRAFSRFEDLSVEEKRKFIFEIIDGIEVRYRRSDTSHILKVLFRSSLLGARKIRVTRKYQRKIEYEEMIDIE